MKRIMAAALLGACFVLPTTLLAAQPAADKDAALGACKGYLQTMHDQRDKALSRAADDEADVAALQRSLTAAQQRIRDWEAYAKPLYAAPRAQTAK